MLVINSNNEKRNSKNIATDYTDFTDKKFEKRNSKFENVEYRIRNIE